MSRSAETEQRALALVEQLLDERGDPATFETLLSRETQAVRARVAALRTAMAGAARIMPTVLPGAASRAAPSPPEQVGAFRLVRKIGEGGMGGVWLAERNDGLYEQTVAVKLIRPGLVDLAGAAFLAERRILARLEHPGIARLIDGGVASDGIPFLVMEYVEGAPIDEAVQGRTLAERVKLLVKAADAVQFAHSRLVVHADLKPSNIIVDPQGRVKLLDFGIARLLENESDAAPSALPMTRAFASPARVAGAPPSIADDVFALGLILREILAGQKDADLAAIAACASAEDEARRYGSVAALIADLDRWRDQLPVAAREATLTYRTGRFVRRHLAGVSATAVALLMLAVLAGLATRSAITAHRASREAQARFEDARGAARLVSDQLLGQLAERPGTFALRSRTAQAAQFYLDRLSDSPGATPEIRLEAALGLQRVAEAQAKPGVPNLGQTEAGEANLTRALALLRGMDGEVVRRLRIHILLDRARILCFGRNDIEAALVDLRQASALLGPPRAGPDLLRAQYLVELASAREWHSDYVQAKDIVRQALAYIPDGDQRDLAILRSTALDLLAEAIYYQDDGAGAIAPYREALGMLMSYDARHPGDQTINRRIAREQWALGSTVVDYGDKNESVALLQESSRRAREIAQADPADADARRMLRIADNALGQALAAAGRVDEGLAMVRANIAERRAWLDKRPRDPMRMRDYMVALKGLGDMQLAHGRSADGCRTYDQARRLVALIRARGQLTALDISGVVKSMEEEGRRQCAGRSGRASPARGASPARST